MSRSGYTDYCEGINLYRGQVASATRGRRGQRLLTDLLAALDAMPDKKLVTDELEAEDGAVCALGALGKARGIDMANIDPHDSETVSATFDIADCLAREIVYINDEHWTPETPEQRWQRVRKWVASQITPPEPPTSSV